MLITCDESIEYKIKIVGSVSIPFDDFLKYESFVNAKRLENRVFGELKWQKIQEEGKYLDFYFTLIKELFSYPQVVFHSNGYKGNKYKASYALVRSISWKLQNMDYLNAIGVLFDYEGKRGVEETELSRDIFQNDIKHKLIFCTQIDSKIFNILQITDILTGCINYKKNIDEITTKRQGSEVKENFINKIEKEIDGESDCTLTTIGLWKYNGGKRLQHYNLG